ncbi:hypothetical protein A3731_00430 [Roseovarius sp. HI0049]|jgi:hypothetical protein|nr:hypothetical protein A3731_00430 [Roseovarius sp. HI0049]
MWGGLANQTVARFPSKLSARPLFLAELVPVLFPRILVPQKFGIAFSGAHAHVKRFIRDNRTMRALRGVSILHFRIIEHDRALAAMT